MKQKILIISLLALLSMTSIVSFSPAALAQEAGTVPAGIPEAVSAGAPDGTQAGPTEAEIQAFQNEFGGPPSSFAPASVADIPEETPGTVPDYVKEYATDAELVEIYCYMAKWKSGDFFSAMDVVPQMLAEPMTKVKALGIDVAIPDTAALKAEGQKKLDAICAAKTVAEAQNLAAEFQAWGKNEAASKFNSLNADLQAKIKEKSDAMTKKVTDQINAYVETEKAVLQAEIEQEINAYVESKKSALQASVTPETSADAYNSLANQMRSDIESRVNAIVAVKKAELETKIRAKVDEIVGPEKQVFEDIGKGFEGIEAKINAGIAAKRGEYDQYKEKAFALRKAVILKMLDKNLETAFAQLEAGRADIDAARNEDPTIKSVDTVIAEIKADRDALAAKLDAALESGNDADFQKYFDEFKAKWENYKTEMEKVATQGVSKACAAAAGQFGPAKAQMSESAKRIKELQAKCSGQTSDECLRVNKFAERFQTILQKFSDLQAEIGMAEKICTNPDLDNRGQIIALFKKIQADAEDLKIYGAALEADKKQVIAESVAAICSQALAQINAADAELKKNNLVVLQNNIDRCKLKNTPECQPVRELQDDFYKLKYAIEDYSKKKELSQNLCRITTDESLMGDLLAALNGLKDQGGKLREAANALQAKQAEKASFKAFCRAVTANLSTAKARLSGGLEEMNNERKRCTNPADERCKQVAANQSRIDDLNSRGQKTMTEIGEIEQACANAGLNPPTQEIVDKAERVRTEGEKIATDAYQLMSDLMKISSQKFAIWIEAESAYAYNSRLGVSNPMAREVNPSWRPPYFGDGTWYMGAGGDYLEYEFTVPTKATYYVWIRDYVDQFQAKGIRQITISFDGKVLGTFAEVAANASGKPKGVLGWHKLSKTVVLDAGKRKMKVVKASTTKGAAILDAFYLTTGTEAPPER